MISHSDGRKDDSGKLRWGTLVPWGPMAAVVSVLEHGAAKYGADNWRHVPDGRRRYVDAAFRHLIVASGGSYRDEESGLPHLAHAACCILFALWFDDPCNLSPK